MIRYAILAALVATPVAATDLSVRVYGGIPSSGQVLVALFASGADWMKTPRSELAVPVDNRGEAKFTLSNIEPGSYGISIIYDEDSDGELDLNLFGIPSEGFGFSNDARANFGPPKWKNVRFELGEVATTINIRLDRAD